MQGKGAGPVNRVELESQVLCAALRQSWHTQEKIGSYTSLRELSHLFPDLLPPPEKESSGSNKANYYAVLKVHPQVPANAVLATYLLAVRRFLKDKGAEAPLPEEKQTDYMRLLNAGLVLRKPRLRLSHDLVVVRRWLMQAQAEEKEKEIETAKFKDKAAFEKVVPEETVTPKKEAAIEPASKASPPESKVEPKLPEAAPVEAIAEAVAPAVDAIPASSVAETVVPEIAVTERSTPEAAKLSSTALSGGAPSKAVASTGKRSDFVFNEGDLHRAEPMRAVPMLIKLLEATQFIGDLEVQALSAQMELAPNVPVEKLILNAGYVNEQQLNSVKLGETLLGQGRITMAQFQVAIYDERTTGLRMAESLQVRGWLTVEVRNSIDEWYQKRT